jgi:hypothetical protein
LNGCFCGKCYAAKQLSLRLRAIAASAIAAPAKVGFHPADAVGAELYPYAKLASLFQ